jgi:hypothetical protein
VETSRILRGSIAPGGGTRDTASPQRRGALKVLAVAVPGQGHVNPILRLAAALLAQGHVVAVACGEDPGGVIARSGAVHVKAGE